MIRSLVTITLLLASTSLAEPPTGCEKNCTYIAARCAAGFGQYIGNCYMDCMKDAGPNKGMNECVAYCTKWKEDGIKECYSQGDSCVAECRGETISIITTKSDPTTKPIHTVTITKCLV